MTNWVRVTTEWARHSNIMYPLLRYLGELNFYPGFNEVGNHCLYLEYERGVIFEHNTQSYLISEELYVILLLGFR